MFEEMCFFILTLLQLDFNFDKEYTDAWRNVLLLLYVYIFLFILTIVIYILGGWYEKNSNFQTYRNVQIQFTKDVSKDART